MKICSMSECTNRSERGIKRITFHRFPKEEIRRKQWIHAVQRGNWIPKSHSTVCSEHFLDEHFDRTSETLVRLRAFAVPSFSKVQEIIKIYQPITEHTPKLTYIIPYSFSPIKEQIPTCNQDLNDIIPYSFLPTKEELPAFNQDLNNSADKRREDKPIKKKGSKKSLSSPQKTSITLSDDEASQAKSEAGGGSPGHVSDSDSDDELLKPKEEVDSDKEGSDLEKTFSFQSHYLYRNAVNLVESPSGAAVVDSSSKSCVVPDCLSKVRRLFDLPRASEPRSVWLELLPWLPDGTSVAQVLLCSHHFSRDYLTPMGLHVDAVPTMNLPDPLSDAWPAQDGKTISNDVVTTSAKLREIGETSPGTLTTLVNASTIGAYRNDFTSGQSDSKGFDQTGVNMQPRILLYTLPALRNKGGTDLPIQVEPELQENPSLYPPSITPAPNQVQWFFKHAALADYMQHNTPSSSYSVGPNLNVPGSSNLSFVIQPMEAKPAIHSSWEVPLGVTNSPSATSMGPSVKKSKVVVIKKVSQTSKPENLKRVRVKRKKMSSIEGDDDNPDISDGLEIGKVRIASPVTNKAVEAVSADDLPLARYISAPCILCKGKCKYKMAMSHHDLKARIFKCFGIKLIANYKFEMCEGCLSQLKNAEYFRTKVHIVNETIIKDDIMNRKVGDPPLETEEPVKFVPQLSEKEMQTIEAPETYEPKDLSNFRILFDEEVDPRNLVDSPSFLRMSSDIYRDGLSLCKKRILIMTEKQPAKLPPVLENLPSFPQKFQPPYESSEYQKIQPAFESVYKKPELPPPPPVEGMYKRDTPAVDYAFKKSLPFFEPEKKVIPSLPPAPPAPPKPKKARVKPIQVEKPLVYTEGRPPTRMGRKPNLTKVYVCKICNERFLEIQLLKTHIEGHKAAGEQKSNIPAPASRPNPNLYHPGPSREFGHIDHHR